MISRSPDRRTSASVVADHHAQRLGQHRRQQDQLRGADDRAAQRLGVDDEAELRARLDRTDLRGAELGLIIDAQSLRGAIVSPGQLVLLAPVLAETLGLVVSDD